jgi:hypothetical protein
MPAARLAQGVTAAQGWSNAAIHDTVAKIAAQAKFGVSQRESLLGRLFRYLWQRLADMLDWFQDRFHADPRVLLYGVGALIVLVIVARVIAERQLAEARRMRGHRRLGQDSRADYWRGAESEATSGRYLEACHSLYTAVLDDLAQRRLLAFHTSKTSGDYARELQLAGFSELAEFRAFVRAFDRAVFGVAEPDGDDYARVRDAARRVAVTRAAA